VARPAPASNVAAGLERVLGRAHALSGPRSLGVTRALGATLAFGATLGLLGACGQTVPHGGVPASPTASASASAPPAPDARRVPNDILPADLDLVARMDLGRARSSLGPEPMRLLSERALGGAGVEPAVRQALERADLVWIGLRVADLLDGDRVMVLEGKETALKLDPADWKRGSSDLEGVVIYDATRAPARSGTARIVDLGHGALAIVSPVEADSVERTLRNGPDAGRRELEARGLVSLDWRAGRPGTALQNRYPSLASLLTGVRRVSAVLDTRGRDLELEGRIECRDPAAAARMARFLRTIAEAGRKIPRYAKLLANLELQDSGSLLRIHWLVAPDLLVELGREPATLDAAVPAATPSASDAAAAPAAPSAGDAPVPPAKPSASDAAAPPAAPSGTAPLQ
jgi:hypothetical protein